MVENARESNEWAARAMLLRSEIARAVVRFMSSHVVFVPTTYTTQAQRDAEAARAKEQTRATAKAEVPEAPDLKSALVQLTTALDALDNLEAKAQEFPRHIAELDAKLTKLEGEDLSTLEALESRQSAAGKLSNMKLLAKGQAEKAKVKVREQQEVVCNAIKSARSF
jgi:hypothetical protein